jgi:hypothetical protein
VIASNQSMDGSGAIGKHWLTKKSLQLLGISSETSEAPKGSGDLVFEFRTTDQFHYFTAPDKAVSRSTCSTTASGRSSGMKWPQPGSVRLLTSLATIETN